ncbi:phospholipase/carboxylesterase [Neorhodopirellula lusitana]|uniref:Phospholipase/carboxylesterase n=1 Tax=Neorhodopirellula lusitana TaxID=445327 RepID=A0ABY1QRM9_9BACT|nr:lysophospholipase [Neorhodopirellula lusitana]SMP78444.1 phospholipase/carboxylesterase [Neorhodopirellula lusitana]
MNVYQKSAGRFPSRPRVETIGPLRCIVVDGSAEPRIPVILCHGYGAPGDDLASLTPHLIDWIGRDCSALRFIYPEAPHSLEELGMPDGRAWWPLNMASMQELMQTNQFSQLHDAEPPEIDVARDALGETVKAVLAGMPGSPAPESIPYCLGGFSQGAMLTMDLALRGTVPPPKTLVQFSGTLICQTKWQAALGRLADTKVLQSHGRVDPILPFSSAEALRDMLRGGGVDVDFVAFQGPHTIETDALFRLVERLRIQAAATA